VRLQIADFRLQISDGKSQIADYDCSLPSQPAICNLQSEL